MQAQLWKYFWQDDVESFAAVLHPQRSEASGQASGHGLSYGSSHGFPASSPNASFKTRTPGKTTPKLRPQDRAVPEYTLTRADVNRRDAGGLTLLHHAASLNSETAVAFAISLINHPLIDLYAQDFENGWTALHRAFYFGNISIARAIIDREPQLLPTQIASSSLGGPSSLIKVKDREGLGPYDLLSATITDRTLHHREPDFLHDDASSVVDEIARRSGSPRPVEDSAEDSADRQVNVRGDEFFSFGSNRNITLGVGDGDDRQYPERISLKRPQYLFTHFHREKADEQADDVAKANVAYAERLRDQAKVPQTVAELPNIVRSTPFTVQDVQMAKFHTAILTNDPFSNLYVCGHGPGGRLGLGNETTQFNFVCLDDFGSGHRKISSIALGQDHTLAVTDRGELFTWGSNASGQLGCGMPKANAKPEECIQASPKQLFGPLKREWIVGVAASRIHSVAYTSTALFTFGKNEGQLGLVDSQAGALKVQSTPRQVQASRLSCAIHSVCAIDRATIVLMESHEVHVFANYGAVRLKFPLDGFSNYFLGSSLPATSYDKVPNRICKITGGGDTICALSTAGEVFTRTVSQRLDPGSASTTNPNKIKAALSSPFRAWTLRSDRMRAKDVGVDSDGSIILCTASGGVWRRVRRVKAASTPGTKVLENKSKDFKFMRVPNLTRAVAVRASASGSYAAIRQECNITRTELDVSPPSLWTDLFGLLSFKSLASDSELSNPVPVFWQRPSELTKLLTRLSQTEDVEDEVRKALQTRSLSQDEDLVVMTSVSDVMIPAHTFVFTGRSAAFRAALGAFKASGQYEGETMRMSSTLEGETIVTFPGVDFLTIVELVLYLYTDTLVGFWQYTRRSPELAFRFRQIRTELIKLATRLDLQNLESAARRMVSRPEQALRTDMELALFDQSFFATGDALVQLADGEMLVHSAMMAKRCPFFTGLFQGQAAGRWLAQRRGESGDRTDTVNVDLSHIELHIFKMVLRHLYADTGIELFDAVVCKDTEEFLDIVMEVLSVANELMLDRLSQICQVVLGRFVNARNACQLLNAVAPCSIPDLKSSLLEYICLNLEATLSNHWLDELDEDLMVELDKMVQDNQLAALPFAKSGQAGRDLLDRHPELEDTLVRNRQSRIDAVALQSKYPDISATLGRSRASPLLRGRTASASTSPITPAKSPSVRAELALSNLETLPSPAPLELPPPTAGLAAAKPVPSSPVIAEKPWGSSPASSEKLSMKDIMNQTSTSRPSNIALGLQSQASNARMLSSQSPKVSQKERKRQQQQQQGRSDAALGSSPSFAGAAGSPVQSSAWKAVPAPKRSSIANAETGSPSATPTLKRAATSEARAPATPQLTMRQTIANTAAHKSEEAAIQPGAPSIQRRSVSTPQVPSKSAVNDGPGMSVGPTAAIPIQSVRHTRRPDTSSSSHMHQSLADIISHEQAEKKTIQDSVAKRSLQEIQEEQAFQEWWDKESRAVQEEAARETSGGRGGRGGGARPRGRNKRGGKQRADQANTREGQRENQRAA